MTQPVIPPPKRVRGVADDAGTVIPDAAALGLQVIDRPETLPCGRSAAEYLVDSFLDTRGQGYHRGMSSPVSAFRQCSRLSSALAYGNLSMREVYQASAQRITALKAAGRSEDKVWIRSLNAHAQRLRWHCHFMQKLEDEPGIETRNMNRAFDGLREEEWNEERYRLWAEGRTGYPMVDACMRALHRGGWINFRMRAMLISFASYHLWLHWRRPAQHLARLFQDFEPGIHYSQVQMQSGTTGINTVRIYSPVKQVLDQDPKGLFIRRYCPELRHVPDDYLAEPHRMPVPVQRRAGCLIGRDYPLPVVEHGPAYREARRRMYSARGRSEAREEARRVYRKHGSRRRPPSRGRPDVKPMS
jgi:deoxyribodipyrimidine photo-lyase